MAVKSICSDKGIKRLAGYTAIASHVVLWCGEKVFLVSKNLKTFLTSGGRTMKFADVDAGDFVVFRLEKIDWNG